MSSIARPVVALTFLLLAGSADAADNELTPHLGLRFGGEVDAGTVRAESLDIAPAFGLTYGHRIRPQGWLWTAWSLQPTEVDAPDLLPDTDTIELDVHYLHVGTSYRPKTKKKAQGFVLFGLGLTWIDPKPGEFDAALGGSMVIGGGLRVPIRPAMAFRLDLRGYGTFTETEVEGQCGAVACSIELTSNGAFQLDVLGGLTFSF